jgi:mono/diheme cytochrome c family protein
VPRLVACLAALALACAGCGAHRASVDVSAGRRLFRAAGCGACHALHDARTRGVTGPDFDTSERLDRAQILSGLVEGANGMPSYADLGRRERRLLTDYLLAVGWRRHGAGG